jgi:hypothetical protein
MPPIAGARPIEWRATSSSALARERAPASIAPQPLKPRREPDNSSYELRAKCLKASRKKELFSQSDYDPPHPRAESAQQDDRQQLAEQQGAARTQRGTTSPSAPR